MYARAHRAAVARSARSWAAGALVASSASAISAAPHSHVALPLGARVVVVRERRDELPHVGGLRHRVDAPGQAQHVLCPHRVTAGGKLRAKGEVGGEAARQVRADRLTGRGRLEHRPVFDEVRGRAGVPARRGVHPVLLLGQEPEVVVALDRVARVAVADPDLRVKHLEHGIPQLGDPLQAEHRLWLERGIRAGEVPRRDQHEGVGVAGGVRKLLIAAARVEPAAGDVDRAADLLQRAEQVVVAVVGRVGVDVGALVGQVGGLAAEDRRVDIRPVALGGEVLHGVVHELPVQLGSVADR